MAALRIAILNIRLVTRTKAALFFTFLFPLVFLFVYAGLFAHGNPQFVAYMFGPVVTLNIMGSAFWGLGLQSVMQRERGSLRRFRLAPIGSGTLVTSNLLANYLLELPAIGLLVLCARIFFHMPLSIGWLTLLALVTVGTFGFAGFGLTIASIANTMQEAQIYNNLVWLTLLFLSGTTVPLPLLPHWLQRLATFLPATYLVSAFQAVMVQAEPLLDHLPEMSALMISGIFGLLFAWKLFRWEKEERIPASSKAWLLVFIIPFILMGIWLNVYASPTKAWANTYSRLARGFAGSEKSSSSEGVLLEDFESPQAGERLKREWEIVAGVSGAGQPGVQLALTSPGAVGSQHALRFEGKLSASADGRARLAVRRALQVGEPLSMSKGIECWIRGDGTRRFQIGLVREGSSLETLPEIRLTPSRDWESVRLPMAGFSAADKDKARRIFFEVSTEGPPGEVYLELDEIRFY